MGELLGVTIRLDRETWKKVRTIAALKSITAASLIRAFIEALVNQEEKIIPPEPVRKVKRQFIATQSPVRAPAVHTDKLTCRVPDELEEEVSRAVFEFNRGRDKQKTSEMTISSFIREALEEKLDLLDKFPGVDTRKR